MSDERGLVNRPVVLLGCGKSKRTKTWRGPIVDLYVGAHYSARRRYAEILGGPHWILSAFHGVRRPDFPAHAYDRTLQDRDVYRWYTGTAGNVLLGDTVPGDRIVVLAGKRYWSGWIGLLRQRGRVVETPLAGLGIGQQLAWLKKPDWTCALCGRAAPGGGVYFCDCQRSIAHNLA